MIHETTTSLGAAAIIQKAKQFFAERVPQYAAYPEKEGASYLTLRGQGGEEIAIAVIPGPAGNRVRASTLLFDQALGRFLSTLPEVA
ncbi:MAG: hypothetical protein ABI647_01855 [Gemmatimonadota bacterium]